MADPRVAGRPAVQPVFFYDLGDPECYLAAERITTAMGVVAEWEPVAGAELGIAPRPVDIDQLTDRAEQLDLQPLRWPPGWPPDTRTAMLAATYAKRTGRVVAFSMAAFRQAFAGGRDLTDQDTVLIAGAACEMHPTALLKGISLRSIQSALATANRRAMDAGVSELPAILAHGGLFTGPGAVEAAGARR